MGKRKPMTEEEKKKKFGENYDPNFKPSGSSQEGEPHGKECNASDKSEYNNRRNDYRWYAPTENIAKAIANFPYAEIPGVESELNVRAKAHDGSVLNIDAPYNNPSVMVLRTTTTVACEPKSGSGINLAATQLYTKIRGKNSGATNYEAPEPIMFVLAMRDIYAHAFEAKRALGLARLYDLENRNLPDTLLKALGFNPADIRENLADYRGRLNTQILRINSMAVPAYFRNFQRLDFVYSNVFTDSSSIRGQFYVYSREGFYKWSGTTSETGTELVFTKFVTPGLTGRTMDYFLDVLDEMLDAISFDQDARTVSGDILKAFDKSALFGLQEVPDGYIVVPSFDEDALAQIENCISLSSYGVESNYISTTTDLSSWNVTQSDQIVKCQPVMTSGTATRIDMQNYLFNSHKDEPDYKDNLEWSRCMMTAQVDFTSIGANVTLTSSGLETILGFEIFTGPMSQIEGSPVPQMTSSLNGTGLINYGALLVTQFDWHPTLYYVMYFTPSGGIPSATISFIADTKVYTFLDKKVIKKVNESAVLAAFYNPDMDY